MDKIISDLESVVTTTGDMLLPVENGAGTFSASIDDVKNYVLSNGATIATKGASILHKQVTCSNGTDTDHDMDFTAGNFQFDDGTGQAILGALTKRFDATFALGTGNGGMRSGESLPTDGTVYIYMISNAGGSITDIIGTTTADGSTISGDSVVIANSMTKKRKLAALVTEGSANIRSGTYYFNPDGSYYYYYFDGILEFKKQLTTSFVAQDVTLPPDVIGLFQCWLTTASGPPGVVELSFKSTSLSSPYLYTTSANSNYIGGSEFSRYCINSEVDAKVETVGSMGHTAYLATLGWYDNNL